MTDAERHQRAKELFLDVLALPAGERAATLIRECAGDEGLRRDVESLLAHASAAEGEQAPFEVVTVGRQARFTSGDVFADRYRIVATVGCGSAGEVYRALDTRLGVEIALKILHRSSPAAVRHLVDEVRLARQINDPTICRIYDIEEVDGEYFLTMELVDGENLASLLARVGRLSDEKVRAIGIQLCRGLAAAHECGVIHRDLKPSNVILDATGAVRLSDFGVAALQSATESAPLAGTLAYMAPEQLREGAPASVKTDLYAVGLILYEALVGLRPPAGGEESVADRPPVQQMLERADDIDDGLKSIVMSLLATNPEDRPDSAAEVVDRLQTLRPPRAGAFPSPRVSSTRRRVKLGAAAGALAAAVLLGYFAIARLRDDARPVAEQVADAAGVEAPGSEAGIAVLPVTDQSEKRDQSHLAEGVQDRIIERLAAIHGLRVIAEESTDRFGSASDAKTVANELGIDFVAIGTLSGDGENARIDLTLHDGKSGKPIWRESHIYGTAPEKALEVDRQVADELAARLRLDKTAPVVSSADVPETQTHTLYLRGREHVPPFSQREFETSVDLLKQVIERAPAFAPAYAAIATAYVTACALRWVEPKEGYPLARRYAERAVQLDGALAEAHVALALIAGEYDWDWPAAESSYARALKLSPGSAWAHRSFARYLSTQGRFEEAITETRRALELDPTSALMAQGAAQRFYEARQYDRAIAMARLAVRLDPINPYSYPTLGASLLEQGAYADAIAQFEKSMIIGGTDATGKARLAYALSRSGEDAAAKEMAAETRRAGTPDSLERALLAMAEHDEAAAIAALAEAVDMRSPPSIWLAVTPPLDPLRNRDDFRALVAKVGLPTVDLAGVEPSR